MVDCNWENAGCQALRLPSPVKSQSQSRLMGSEQLFADLDRVRMADEQDRIDQAKCQPRFKTRSSREFGCKRERGAPNLSGAARLPLACHFTRVDGPAVVPHNATRKRKV